MPSTELSAMDHEAAPFLLPKEHPTAVSSPRSRKPSPLHRAMTHPFLIHGAIAAIYTLIFLLSLRSHSHRCAAAPPTSPVHDLDRQSATTLFRNLTGNPYAGAPSDETDAAWATLLAPMHLRVTGEELERDNQASVPLPEGGGYLGWLGVFHELHCVEMLRKWNYREHYHPNLSGEEEKHMVSHVDHCIDLLRQTALCHADASLTTFVWHPAKQRPMFNASESMHECIDWTRLMASIADRVVGQEEILRLENPLMRPEHAS